MYFNFGGAGAPLYSFSGRSPDLVGQRHARGYAILGVSAKQMT